MTVKMTQHNINFNIKNKKAVYQYRKRTLDKADLEGLKKAKNLKRGCKR